MATDVCLRCRGEMGCGVKGQKLQRGYIYFFKSRDKPSESHEASLQPLWPRNGKSTMEFEEDSQLRKETTISTQRSIILFGKKKKRKKSVSTWASQEILVCLFYSWLLGMGFGENLSWGCILGVSCNTKVPLAAPAGPPSSCWQDSVLYVGRAKWDLQIMTDKWRKKNTQKKYSSSSEPINNWRYDCGLNLLIFKQHTIYYINSAYLLHICLISNQLYVCMTMYVNNFI